MHNTGSLYYLIHKPLSINNVVGLNKNSLVSAENIFKLLGKLQNPQVGLTAGDEVVSIRPLKEMVLSILTEGGNINDLWKWILLTHQHEIADLIYHNGWYLPLEVYQTHCRPSCFDAYQVVSKYQKYLILVNKNIILSMMEAFRKGEIDRSLLDQIIRRVCPDFDEEVLINAYEIDYNLCLESIVHHWSKMQKVVNGLLRRHRKDILEIFCNLGVIPDQETLKKVYSHKDGKRIIKELNYQYQEDVNLIDAIKLGDKETILSSDEEITFDHFKEAFEIDIEIARLLFEKLKN